MMDSPAKPDMDSPEQIRLFVEHFYEQLLADKQLAPLLRVRSWSGCPPLGID